MFFEGLSEYPGIVYVGVDQGQVYPSSCGHFSYAALEERVFFLGVTDNWTESHASRGVVVPHGLGLSKGLQEGVGLGDLVFQGSLIISEKRKREDFGRLLK